MRSFVWAAPTINRTLSSAQEFSAVQLSQW